MKPRSSALALAFALGCGAAVAQAPTEDSVTKLVSNWDETARFAAQTTMQKYGPPAEATPTRLVWFDNGPWKRTVITNEPTEHDFPLPHRDVMEQTVAYEVPPDKFDDLAAYDGSVYIDRTRGEMSARCDLEPANFIALNLAHDIITGKRSVEQARKQYAGFVVSKMTTKEPVPYAESLTFDPPEAAGFSDKTVLSQEMLQQVKQRKQAMMEKVLGAAAAAGRTAPQSKDE